jgi:hypothetical protein
MKKAFMGCVLLSSSFIHYRPSSAKCVYNQKRGTDKSRSSWSSRKVNPRSARRRLARDNPPREAGAQVQMSIQRLTPLVARVSGYLPGPDMQMVRDDESPPCWADFLLAQFRCGCRHERRFACDTLLLIVVFVHLGRGAHSALCRLRV